MLRREEDETTAREVSLWLKRNGFPYERYKTLESHNKAVLHNLVCIPTRPTTARERKDLYKNLCLSDIAGRDSIDPIDFMPDEKLRKFFTPVDPSETLSYFEKF